jgi:hypothetical protein
MCHRALPVSAPQGLAMGVLHAAIRGQPHVQAARHRIIIACVGAGAGKLQYPANRLAGWLANILVAAWLAAVAAFQGRVASVAILIVQDG